MAARKTFVAVLLAAGFAAGPAGADSLSINLNIGTPAPPPVVAAPPQLALVPGSGVSYAPGAQFNLFAYGGRYWSHHNGVWFSVAIGGGEWTVVAGTHVPQPVLTVPVTYYKIPPGHAKKMDGRSSAPGRGHGPKGKPWKHR